MTGRWRQYSSVPCFSAGCSGGGPQAAAAAALALGQTPWLATLMASAAAWAPCAESSGRGAVMVERQGQGAAPL